LRPAAEKALSEFRGVEKNLACRRAFETINYSKESIEIRLCQRTSTGSAQASENKKPGTESTGFFSSINLNGAPFRLSTNYIIPIILPNVIHQCKKKNL
jgi:hypothetical protein